METWILSSLLKSLRELYRRIFRKKERQLREKVVVQIYPYIVKLEIADADIIVDMREVYTKVRKTNSNKEKPEVDSMVDILTNSDDISEE